MGETREREYSADVLSFEPSTGDSHLRPARGLILATGVQLAQAQEEAQEAASRTSQLLEAAQEASQQVASLEAEAGPIRAKAEQLQQQVHFAAGNSDISFVSTRACLRCPAGFQVGVLVGRGRVPDA